MKLALSIAAAFLLAGAGDADRAPAALRLQTAHWHEHGISSFALSKDGKTLATAGYDGVRIWDVATTRLGSHLRVPVHGVHVNSLALSPDGRRLGIAHAIGTNSRVIDVRTGKTLFHLSAKGLPGSAGHAVAFSGDGKLVALAGASPVVLVFDVADGKLRHRFDIKEINYGVGGGGVAFQPGGKMLAVTGTDTRGRPVGRLFDLAEGKAVSFFGGAGPVSFSPDGKRFAYVGADQVDIRFSDPKRAAASFIKTRYPARAVAFGPGGLLAVADDAARVQLYDEAGKPQGAPSETRAMRGGLAFAEDGKHLFVSEGRRVRALNVPRLDAAFSIPARAIHPAGPIAVSADGKKLAAGDHLHDLATGRMLSLKRPYPDRVLLRAFSPDGRQLAEMYAGAYGQLFVGLTDTSTGKRGPVLQAAWYMHNSFFQPVEKALAFSPDGKVLALAATGSILRKAADVKGPKPGKGARPGHVQLWTVGEKEPRVLARFAGPVHSLRFTDGGKKVFVVGEGFVSEREVATGKEVRKYAPMKDGWEKPVAVSPDGKVLLAFGGPVSRAGQELAAYDLASGKKLLSLEEHEVGLGLGAGRESRAVGSAVLFAPDGSLFVSGNSLSRWDLKAKKRLARGEMREGRYAHIAFGGKALLVSEAEGTVTARDMKGASLDVLARLGYTADYWMAITPKGQYDFSDRVAPPELYAVVDGAPVDVSKAAGVKREPGLLAKLLGLEGPAGK